MKERKEGKEEREEEHGLRESNIKRRRRGCRFICID